MNKLIDIIKYIDFDDDAEIKGLFSVFDVSFFEHYLTEQEYTDVPLICYGDIKGDTQKQTVFNTVESRFISLYENLYKLSKNNISMIVEDKIYHNVDKDRYDKSIAAALRESPLCGVIFEQISLYVLIGYDFTHTFYLLKESDTPRMVIENYVHDAKLHILTE